MEISDRQLAMVKEEVENDQQKPGLLGVDQLLRVVGIPVLEKKSSWGGSRKASAGCKGV